MIYTSPTPRPADLDDEEEDQNMGETGGTDDGEQDDNDSRNADGDIDMEGTDSSAVLSSSAQQLKEYEDEIMQMRETRQLLEKELVDTRKRLMAQQAETHSTLSGQIEFLEEQYKKTKEKHITILNGIAQQLEIDTSWYRPDDENAWGELLRQVGDVAIRKSKDAHALQIELEQEQQANDGLQE